MYQRLVCNTELGGTGDFVYVACLIKSKLLATATGPIAHGVYKSSQPSWKVQLLPSGMLIRHCSVCLRCRHALLETMVSVKLCLCVLLCRCVQVNQVKINKIPSFLSCDVKGINFLYSNILIICKRIRIKNLIELSMLSAGFEHFPKRK